VVNGAGLGISLDLSSVGFSEADDMYPGLGLGKAQDVNASAEETDRDDPGLGVLLAVIDGEQRGVEVELSRELERQAAQADVALVLGRVEGDPRPAVSRGF
jgi:hypothetical protein